MSVAARGPAAAIPAAAVPAAAVPAADDARWAHRFADVNGVRLHYVEAGAGPLVVLLHGFPEFWYAWRRQIPAIAAAGFRVIAPDLRGYNLSEKPRGIGAYGMGAVADDVQALIRSLGAPRASVVGHDWGASVAWALAMQHPASVERLCILNGVHPLGMLRGLSKPKQLLRSWYIFFFQLPWLPEHVVRRRGFASLISTFRRNAAADGWASEEFDSYREAFEKPGALEAMINYYRALSRPARAVPVRRVEAPVLVLWGERDPFLGRELAQPPAGWVPHARVEYLPECGHFLQHEQPVRVSERLVGFLEQPTQGTQTYQRRDA